MRLMSANEWDLRRKQKKKDKLSARQPPPNVPTNWNGPPIEETQKQRQSKLKLVSPKHRMTAPAAQASGATFKPIPFL